VSSFSLLAQKKKKQKERAARHLIPLKTGLPGVYAPFLGYCSQKADASESRLAPPNRLALFVPLLGGVKWHCKFLNI